MYGRATKPKQQTHGGKMGQQNKTVDNMSYSTTKTDLINKLEALKINFTVLNEKREDADKTLSEINTYLNEYPEDIEFKVKQNEIIDKQHTITANLSYILNQMEETKKIIDKLDVVKAVNDWLHTPENVAFDRRFNRVMSKMSSSLNTETELNVATDDPKIWRSFPLGRTEED